jgi:hypothetical protein
MELLLLVLIIPMIPFYILSTFLSAGIFVIGIPFIFLAAIGAFLRGFVGALISRNVFPTLHRWKERFGEMRRTGKWSNDDSDPGSPPPHPAMMNHRPEFYRSLSNHTSPVLSSEPTVGSNYEHMSTFGLNILESIPLLAYLRDRFLGMEGLHMAEKTSLWKQMAGEKRHSSHRDSQKETTLKELGSLHSDPLYISGMTSSRFLGSESRKRREKLEQAISLQNKQKTSKWKSSSAAEGKFELLRELVDALPPNPAPDYSVEYRSRYKPNTFRSSILATSYDADTRFAPLSEVSQKQSLYTAQTHQSLYELAQEASSIHSKNFFDELVVAADESLEDIHPNDSASQTGSEMGKNPEFDERADTTDAAKLLSMFALVGEE